MSNIKSRCVIFKNIISCCIIVSFFLFISTFIYFLFDVEKLSPEDEARLKSQMDNVLLEYKNTMSGFEKQEEITEIATLYAIDVSPDDPNKEIQYVGGTYSIDISSDICLDVNEGLWIDTKKSPRGLNLWGLFVYNL